MGERPTDRGEGTREGSAAALARPRVVLVMVECVCADADVPALELAAETWAQSVRYRSDVNGAHTLGAAGAVIEGSADVLRAAVSHALEGFTK